ncbi:hypothetical protein HF668_11165 [Acidithiobacillus ferridurans]|uniref:hypothetical protein n=1 Tax=Acidithiobacillus ferridurans TaxID=1232575 RepID=UPI001C07A9D3|nr:hypothetical protein [Acidithiobacillus ferridurans]MBU2805693.1 hypothetical protein [Acidithiobacillus ferridurans]
MRDNERLLLSTLLYHGGVCDARLAGQVLGVGERQARNILSVCSEMNWVRRVWIDGTRDPSRYYQITATAARILGHRQANVARRGMDAGWLRRGLARVWFRANYRPDGGAFLNGQAEIQAAFQCRNLRQAGTGAGRLRYLETVIEHPQGLEMWSFPAEDRPLKEHVEATVLRFADSLGPVKLGWCIDETRAGDLQKIVSEIAGWSVPFHSFGQPGTDKNDAAETLQEKLSRARTALEKAAAMAEIERARSGNATPKDEQPEPSDDLGRAFLPGIIHGPL